MKYRVRYYSKNLKLTAEHIGTPYECVCQMFPEIDAQLFSNFDITGMRMSFENGSTCTIDRLTDLEYDDIYPEVNSAFKKRR